MSNLSFKKIHLDWKRIIYPVIFGLFTIICFIAFGKLISYSRSTLNEILDENHAGLEQNLVHLNMVDFETLAVKLGVTTSKKEISVENKSVIVSPAGGVITTTIPAATTTGAVVSSTGAVVSTTMDDAASSTDAVGVAFNVTTTEIVAKNALKIAIYNASGKSGLANDLKKDFEANGLLVAKVGNFPLTMTTTLKAKDDVEGLERVNIELAKKYPVFEKDVLSALDEFDVVVIIGKNF